MMRKTKRLDIMARSSRPNRNNDRGENAMIKSNSIDLSLSSLLPPKHAALAFLFLLFGSFQQLVRADVVELKTAERIEGNLKQATGVTVAIEVGGPEIRFATDKVRAIYFGAASSLGPSTAQQQSTLDTARKALNPIQSMTSVGVSYVEYRPKLQETNIEVDGFYRMLCRMTPLSNRQLRLPMASTFS